MSQAVDIIPNHVSGDTFEGRSYTISKNLSPINLTDASIKIDFRYASPTGPVHLSLSTGNGLSITNYTGGVFQINKQIINLQPGKYFFDIEITLSNGDIKTYITGTWQIINSITN